MVFVSWWKKLHVYTKVICTMLLLRLLLPGQTSLKIWMRLILSWRMRIKLSPKWDISINCGKLERIKKASLESFVLDARLIPLSKALISIWTCIPFWLGTKNVKAGFLIWTVLLPFASLVNLPTMRASLVAGLCKPLFQVFSKWVSALLDVLTIKARSMSWWAASL